MSLPIVAFICVHNACRSQIAQALGQHLASDTFLSVSAGTEIAKEIHPLAIQVLNDRYGIDVIKTGQAPKTIDQIPIPDRIIYMGCNVTCPTLNTDKLIPSEDWGIPDPSQGDLSTFEETAKIIEMKILDLRQRLKDN